MSRFEVKKETCPLREKSGRRASLTTKGESGAFGKERSLKTCLAAHWRATSGDVAERPGFARRQTPTLGLRASRPPRQPSPRRLRPRNQGTQRTSGRSHRAVFVPEIKEPKGQVVAGVGGRHAVRQVLLAHMAVFAAAVGILGTKTKSPPAANCRERHATGGDKRHPVRKSAPSVVHGGALYYITPSPSKLQISKFSPCTGHRSCRKSDAATRCPRRSPSGRGARGSSASGRATIPPRRRSEATSARRGA